jgi:hypothetical protein
VGAAYGKGCETRATSSGSEIESSANTRRILAYIARKIYSIYTKNLRRMLTDLAASGAHWIPVDFWEYLLIHFPLNFTPG